jgi:DNA-binding PadR family transcriptional regulator
VRLTRPQRELLESADKWTDNVRHGTQGVGVHGAQHRTIRTLEKLGLVEYIGHGTSIDGDNGDPERAIYAVTEAGRKAAEVKR